MLGHQQIDLSTQRARTRLQRLVPSDKRLFQGMNQVVNLARQAVVPPPEGFAPPHLIQLLGGGDFAGFFLVENEVAVFDHDTLDGRRPLGMRPAHLVEDLVDQVDGVEVGGVAEIVHDGGVLSIEFGQLVVQGGFALLDVPSLSCDGFDGQVRC